MSWIKHDRKVLQYVKNGNHIKKFSIIFKNLWVGFGLVGVYDISTLEGYQMPNPVIYICMICKSIVTFLK